MRFKQLKKYLKEHFHDTSRRSGFQNFRFLKKAIEEITDGEMQLADQEPSLKNYIDYVNKFKNVALKEIEIAFSLSATELDSAVEGLLATGIFEKVKRGNWYFVQAKNILGCDVAKGRDYVSELLRLSYKLITLISTLKAFHIVQQYY